MAELDAMGKPGCDLEGSTVLFEDGFVITIKPIGVNSSSHSTSEVDGHYVQNWGVPGAAVAIVMDEQVSGLWGSTAESKELTRQLLGLADIH